MTRWAVIRKPPRYCVVPADLVFGQRELADSLWRTYVVLLSLTWYTGYEYCLVTLRELAEVLGVEEEGVRKRLWKLEKAGLIARRRVDKHLTRITPLLAYRASVVGGAAVTSVDESGNRDKVSQKTGNRDKVSQKPAKRDGPSQKAAPSVVVVVSDSATDVKNLEEKQQQQQYTGDESVDEWTVEQERAFHELVRCNVLEGVAEDLVDQYPAEMVRRWAVYAQEEERLGRIRNAAGLVIAMLRRGREAPDELRHYKSLGVRY